MVSVPATKNPINYSTKRSMLYPPSFPIIPFYFIVCSIVSLISLLANFFSIAWVQTALYFAIFSFMILSSANKPSLRMGKPNRKYLRDRYWAMLSLRRVLIQFVIGLSSIFSLKDMPKKVLMTVSPEIYWVSAWASNDLSGLLMIYWILLLDISLMTLMKLL